MGGLAWEDPLEEGLAMHSSILAWRISMDRGAWWGTDDGIAESDTEQLTKHSVWASRYNEGVEGPQRGGWGFRAGGSQPNALEKEMATPSSIFAWRISMDRGAWQVTVYRIAKSQTQLRE